MSTASTPINVSAPLELSWYREKTTSEYYIYMHFSEVVKLKANQSRSFNITINGKHWFGPFTPKYLHTITVYSPSILGIAQKYDILISKIENSTLPPIINALEIYSVIDLSQSGTDKQDGKFSSTHVNLVPFFFFLKLYFITLNYSLNYTLHHKLFEYMFCTLNYDYCYTLHPDVKFAINLDVNIKFRVQNIIKSIVEDDKV